MNRRMSIAVAGVILLGNALAQERKLLEESFRSYDRNGDGSIARREFPGSDRQFGQMDGNRNGKVTLEEYVASPVARRMLEASYSNRNEPRARTTTDQLLRRRLEWVSRFDKNRDGKVTSAEWLGSNAAFATLDADGNGVIDARDKAEALGRTPDEPAAPEITRRLPNAEELLKRLDRDKDNALSEKEAERSAVLAALFAPGDRNRDQKLDAEELQRIVNYVARVLQERERQRAKPRPFKVPFSAWDENDDDRLEQNEWKQRRDLFPRIDRNRDAAVTREEIARYEKMIEGDDFIGRFDLNGDGRVTQQEFGGPLTAFARADRNGDGVVTRADR